MPKESRKKGKINGIKEQKTKQTRNRSQQSHKSVLSKSNSEYSEENDRRREV